MPKYKIDASYISYLTLEIEADNLDEAKEMAYNAEASDFKEIALGDWNIDNVAEALS